MSSRASSPRDFSPTPASNSEYPQHSNRKRKHVTSAPSPPAAQGNPADNVVLSGRNDLSARVRLSISRGPNFVPISEGSEYHATEQLAMNRIGFRYIPAGLTPLGSALPCRTIESNPTCFRVSWEDRSPLIKVTTDGLGLLGDKGFRSARCNVPIREGRWYMEVKVEHGGGDKLGESSKREGSHVRLGWARREAPLNGPVGLDGYSYGVRDKTGEKVTLSRPRGYGRPFTSGDVVGMYISLPPRREAKQSDPYDPAHLRRERIAIEFKGQEYFEALEYTQSKEMIALMDHGNKSAKATSLSSVAKKSATVKNVPERGRGSKTDPETKQLRPLPILPGSHIAFFVNGKCQGTAFQDLYDFLPLRAADLSRKSKEKKRHREGAREHKENHFDDGCLGYYPFISLFNDARIRINPGPDFEYPPPINIEAILSGDTENDSPEASKWRPICQRYPEFMAEQWKLDEQEEEDAKVEAVHRLALEKVEAEKRAQKEKKRLQAEARKRAKKANEEQQREIAPLTLDDERFGPNASMSLPAVAQPSPLRHGMVYQLDGGDDEDEIPTPTIDFNSALESDSRAQSGYNSEYGDGDVDEVMEELTYHRCTSVMGHQQTSVSPAPSFDIDVDINEAI